MLNQTNPARSPELLLKIEKHTNFQQLSDQAITEILHDLQNFLLGNASYKTQHPENVSEHIIMDCLCFCLGQILNDALRASSHTYQHLSTDMSIQEARTSAKRPTAQPDCAPDHTSVRSPQLPGNPKVNPGKSERHSN